MTRPPLAPALVGVALTGAAAALLTRVPTVERALIAHHARAARKAAVTTDQGWAR